MPEPVPDLATLRHRLDDVDRALVELVARRLDLVRSIGTRKSQGGAAVRDADRERRVFESVERVARELGVPVPLVRRLFEELVRHSVTVQVAALSRDGSGASRPVRVAYQGVEWANSYLAAQKYLTGLGLAGRLEGHRSFRGAVAALSSGQADLALLPIENTTAGSINEVYDLLREEDVFLVGEETWRVDHSLAGPAEVPLDSLTRVLSHPQGLEQCSTFLESLPHCTPVTYFDTAEAMRLVAAEGDPTQAAIGPPEAAAAFGLVVLQHGIANQEENWTRFVVLSRTPAEVNLRVPAKTSLVLVTRHEEGALLRCLEVLSGSRLSLTKLESRPRPGRPWEYLFFVDFDGNLAEPRVGEAMDELRNTALFLKVLGSYPAKATPGQPQPSRLDEIVEVGSVGAAPAPTPAAPAPGPAGRSKHYRLADRRSRGEDTVIRVGGLLIGGAGFTVMAGPCSVESAQQINDTARWVRGHGAHLLRGGVFKPRTSPYAFQGLGYDGLELLAAAGRDVGMPVVTEVMAVEQVRRLAERADILQIGARNMQNFDLLREVGRVDRPVLLKRGLSSTIDEWLGAAEYILAQGNGQVILCERGIRTFESATRNTLDLSAVVVLRERTHLPVIVDPSHGTGHRRYVPPMAVAARAVGAHGLLIEVHPDPDRAQSDGAQSLDFPGFAGLMTALATPATGPAYSPG